ncbi:alr0857 family protein [Leptothoe sp. PORK10 BA2]|uniref:alr0857 family protein n=1 Tax=Leptothoe sp. PORK10 BA2 TaxID=3110254 RepID=UPI002B20EDD5|nr:alr0857 family protein [Leptothoe sp. PORK10 BA2]MEA5462521.1 hypothetical protein [Leptothoe sp. PORK10 BA2]
MLKLIYTDYGLCLEKVPASKNAAASLDAMITQQVMLAVQGGETLHLEPGRASFLLPVKIAGIAHLESILKSNTTDAIKVTTVDDDFVEISLKGTWMTNSSNAEFGTFITVLSPKIERLIYQLWQSTQ